MTITGITFDRAKVTAAKDALLYHVLAQGNQGILPGYGNDFDVTASGLNVVVGTGMALMSGRLIENDAPVKVSIPPEKTGSIAIVVDLTVLNESSGTPGTDGYHFVNKQVQLKFIEEKLNPATNSVDGWKQYFVEGDLNKGDTLITLRLAYGTSDMKSYNFTKFMRRECVTFAKYGLILNTGSRKLGITPKPGDVVLNLDSDFIVNATDTRLNSRFSVSGWATLLSGLSAKKDAYFEAKSEFWGEMLVKNVAKFQKNVDFLQSVKFSDVTSYMKLATFNLGAKVIKGLEVHGGISIKSGSLNVTSDSDFQGQMRARKGIKMPAGNDFALTEAGEARSMQLIPLSANTNLASVQKSGRYVWSATAGKKIKGLPKGIPEDGAWFILDVSIHPSGQNGFQTIYESGRGRNSMYYRVLSAKSWQPWQAVLRHVKHQPLKLAPNVKSYHYGLDIDGHMVNVHLWGASGIRKSVNQNHVCYLPKEYAPSRPMSFVGVVDSRWARYILEPTGCLWLANWDAAANPNGNGDINFSYMMAGDY